MNNKDPKMTVAQVMIVLVLIIVITWFAVNVAKLVVGG
jgi:hypothetical protein